MRIRERCLVTFNTSLGKRKTIGINEPRDTISQTNVGNLAGLLLNAPVFDASIGTLVSLVGAQVVTETTRTII
jgi:hypothetical protein